MMNFSDVGKMKEMLEQAKQMQEQMERKLVETVVEASSGGGVVMVRMNGKKEVLRVRIEPSAIGSSGSDLELLEDLIAAAVNEAGRRADALVKSECGWDDGRVGSAGYSGAYVVAGRFAEPMTRLIDELRKLPGVGTKSAQRLAFHMLRSSDADARGLAEAILVLREKLRLLLGVQQHYRCRSVCVLHECGARSAGDLRDSRSRLISRRSRRRAATTACITCCMGRCRLARRRWAGAVADCES